MDELIDLRSVANEPEALDGRTALELLQAVYRDKRQPLSVRMRAAHRAIEFESPRLTATAFLDNGEAFAERLDAALKRSFPAMRVIEHRKNECE